MLKIYIVLFLLGMITLLLGLFAFPGILVICGFIVSGVGAVQIIKKMREKYSYKGVSSDVPVDPYADTDKDDQEE